MQQIDLTDVALWKVVPVLDNPEIERYAYFYAMGACGKPYDALGILGIGWDAPKVHDEMDRFCSGGDASKSYSAWRRCSCGRLSAVGWKVAPS